MKDNSIIIRGYVKSESNTWYKTLDNGEQAPIQVLTKLIVIRNKRDVGDRLEYKKRDIVWIMTRNEDMMKTMIGLKPYDIVLVKGSLTTRNTLKSRDCPECGEKTTSEGTIHYIEPVTVNFEKHCRTKEEAIEDIDFNDEFSNILSIIGEVLEDPKEIKTEKGLYISQYPLKVRRKLHIHEDPPHVTSDFPYVKAYGKNARNDQLHLQQGAMVMIDGCLQGRNHTRKTICPKCKTAFEWKDYALEIVPYETEYISGFKTDDEIEEQASKKMVEARSIITSNKDEE